MKKTLLATLAIAATLGANEVSNQSMCQSMAKGFGNGYDMTKKTANHREFCEKIVKQNVTNGDICTFKELIDGCVNQIESKQQ